MQAQGWQSLYDMEELSVMGLVEVLARIRRLLFVRKSMLKHFLANPPDVFIGVDAPDFNLGLELKLKKQGIKTVQYVSPTVWAWREKRIFKIAKATHLVLSIFPFEKQVYDNHQIPCEFVGHTMADDIAIKPDKKRARQSLQLKDDSIVLAVLPGSRKREVDTLLDVFMQSCLLLKSDIPGLKVLIPVINRQRKDQVDDYIQTHKHDLSIQVVIGHARNVMIASDAVLLASGTATLEAMLCKKNMVTAYKLSGLTYQMMKWLYKAKYFALPNVLANEKNLNLSFESSEPELIVYFDWDKMDKILNNLISNSIKYTPDSGNVKVSLSFINNGISKKSNALDLNSEIEIIVEDTGVGIPENKISKIFRR